ncbi:MAG: D-alanine--D-alanine ligase [candidate division WOR-3 bacterium]|nr:D-alanine--D-alanine ligase [candidate division WOR-3 bacterium]
MDKELIAPLKDKRVVVVSGGWSSEREVSLLSGRNVFEALRRQGVEAVSFDLASPDDLPKLLKEKPDVIFIALHGKPGEDGSFQGFSEVAGIPYTGSGVEASAIGIDKWVSKWVFARNDIPTPRFVPLPGDADHVPAAQKAAAEFGFPVIIKPRFEGSSVGVHIVHEELSLLEQTRRVQAEFGDVLLEEFISGVTGTAGILGDEVLPLLELVPKTREFYDYQAKYTKGETQFICPARMDAEQTELTQELALRAFRSIGARHFGRVDFMLAENSQPYLLEVNTIPGLTDLSDLPAEAEVVGISYDELIVRITLMAIGER